MIFLKNLKLILQLITDFWFGKKQMESLIKAIGDALLLLMCIAGDILL